MNYLMMPWNNEIRSNNHARFRIREEHRLTFVFLYALSSFACVFLGKNIHLINDDIALFKNKIST